VSSDAATPKFRALLTAAGWSPERVQDVVVWRRSAG
jgi:hypothetical protein